MDALTTVFPPLTPWKGRVDYTRQPGPLSSQEAEGTRLTDECLLMSKSSALSLFSAGQAGPAYQKGRFAWVQVAWNEPRDTADAQGTEGRTRQCCCRPWAPPPGEQEQRA